MLYLCPQVRRRAAVAVTLPLVLALRAVLAALAAACLLPAAPHLVPDQAEAIFPSVQAQVDKEVDQ